MQGQPASSIRLVKGEPYKCSFCKVVSGINLIGTLKGKAMCPDCLRSITELLQEEDDESNKEGS